MKDTAPIPPGAGAEVALHARFRHWRRVDLRFADLDVNGHVNNVAFALFSQEGRTRMFADAGMADGAEGRSWRIVRLLVSFETEIHFPGHVEIGTRLAGIGRSSLRLEQVLLNGGRAAARTEIVMVQVEDASGRPAEIDAARRQRLEAVAGPPDAQAG
jgi:acyl-CoA thioester hydrolase